MDDDRPEQIVLTQVDGLAAGVAFDALGRVDCDRRCVRCWYNLRGLDSAGVCPECALPVVRSLSSNRLKYADQKWLRTVQDGLWLVIISFAAHIAVTYVWFASDLVRNTFGSVYVVDADLDDAIWIAYSLCAAVGLIGVFFATAREAPESATASDDRVRRWARRLTCACLAAIAGMVLLERAPSFRNAFGWRLPTAITFLASIGAALSNCIFLRNLLRRTDAGGEDLARVAMTGALVLGILLLIPTGEPDLFRLGLGSLYLVTYAALLVVGALLQLFILALLIKTRRAVRRALHAKRGAQKHHSPAR